jgi:hypothetical protein
MEIGFCHNDGGRVANNYSESNDCAVRAYSLFFDVPYPEAHKVMEKIGRKPGKGTPTFPLCHTLDQTTAIRKLKYWDKRMTVNQVVRKHPKGKVFCLISNHAFTIIDGTVHDTFKPGKKQRVFSYWVLPETETVVESVKMVRKSRGEVNFDIQSIVLREKKVNENISSYAVAKIVSKEVGISIASAYYHVKKHY